MNVDENNPFHYYRQQSVKQAMHIYVFRYNTELQEKLSMCLPLDVT